MKKSFTSLVSKLQSKLNFNIILLILFTFTLTVFKVQQPLNIMFKTRTATLQSIKNTHKIKTTIYGNSIQAKIMNYINNYISVQSPSCDYDCANNCVNQVQLNSKSFREDFFNICLVDDCECESSSDSYKTTNGFGSNLTIFMVMFSIIITYLVVIFSINPVAKASLFGYDKIFNDDVIGEINSTEENIEYKTNLL